MKPFCSIVLFYSVFSLTTFAQSGWTPQSSGVDSKASLQLLNPHSGWHINNNQLFASTPEPAERVTY